MTYLEELADEIRSAVPRDVLPGEDTTDLFVLYAVRVSQYCWPF
jgi:hypothetical protein